MEEASDGPRRRKPGAMSLAYPDIEARAKEGLGACVTPQRG